MDATVVIERHVETAAFANEPVMVTRFADGRVLRELGGRNSRGGTTYINHWTQVSPAGTWPASALPVHLMIGLPRSRDLGAAEDGLVEVAARTWGRTSCTSFRATVAGTTTTGPGDDGISGVYFFDTAWPTMMTPGAIATTLVHVNAQGQIYDTDIYVNGQDHIFSADDRAGTVDFRSIAVHEIGHVLGLGESADPTATMYTAYPPGVSWRAIEQDDENGVCTLYPGVGDALGCDATPCPSGFQCVARDCMLAKDQRMTCSPCEPSLLNGCEGMGHLARCVAYDAGYACGRPCTSNDDCGPGFACQPTTGAGDYQCIAADGCSHAEDTCTTQADCSDPGDAGWVCNASTCLGALPEAGIIDAGSDSEADSGTTWVATGGCNTSGTPNDARSLAWLAWSCLFGARRRLRRPRI